MNFLLRLFYQPFARIADAFFKHDLTLRRDHGSVHLVLQQREPGAKAAARPVSREELAARKAQQELALIRTELAALLEELPGTRQTMRHLAFVEQALAKRGLQALHKLPLEVLEPALEQFEGLVTNWSPLGLASLRSKMAVAIIDREHLNPDAEADAYRTAAVLDAGGPPAEAVAARHSEQEQQALAAAYAVLGQAAPATIGLPYGETTELHGELGSAASREAARDAARQAPPPRPQLRLRELSE